MKRSIKIYCFLLLADSVLLLCQDRFVTVSESGFLLNGELMNFVGINAFYLQSIYSEEEKRHIIEEVFKCADKYELDVIRTWAFNESDGESRILSGPYAVNESGLVALDYILYLADLYQVKVILTLSNNHGDFGGVPKYISWANERLPPGGFGHSDFFLNDSVKSWFKFYLSALLNRINSFNGIKYKNDTNIFSFELMNEAVCPGQSIDLLLNWYDEMSEHFKSIDSNHLLATGETGYDAYYHHYSDIDLFYDGSRFILDGSKGSGYLRNSGLANIDYASYHLYPSQWRISHTAGKTWIRDHRRIASQINKPSLLGEFGALKEKHLIINEYMEVLFESKNCSGILWQYVHPDLKDYDDFGFNEIKDPELFDLIGFYILKIKSPANNGSVPENPNILYQNYPNPFNPTTRIVYYLNAGQSIVLKLYDLLGEEVGILDEGYREAGEHILDLSFQNRLLSSGIYIYELRTENSALRKKLMLLK